MMRYQIEALDQDTREIVVFEVDARDEQWARKAAEVQGFIVNRATPVEIIIHRSPQRVRIDNLGGLALAIAAGLVLAGLVGGVLSMVIA
ncbi:MAG: hypothetical protein AAGI53_08290 [Planctomycetota bacterium]